MKILFRIAALAATIALAAGCCNCRSYQKKTRRPLVGTEWQLIQLEGRSVKAEPGTYTLTLEAEGNHLSGVGACNRLMGSYSTGERRALKIGPLASTKMACPNLDQEQQFLRAIESTTHYDMDGPMLLLLSNGELRAVFQAK
ncbi:MAG TPA: META domain-containing protein [Candidatus Alistipes intestinipullorum]|nr:META domain-containing protein [Candidatus Alistipes intestinipullorum]